MCSQSQFKPEYQAILNKLNGFDSLEYAQARTKEKWEYAESLPDDGRREFAINWVKNQ